VALRTGSWASAAASRSAVRTALSAGWRVVLARQIADVKELTEA